MTTHLFVPALPGPASVVATGLVQRACACGGAPGRSGECEACRRRREGTLAAAGAQAKLRIGAPGDALEREADEVAEQVMRAPAGDEPGATVLRRAPAGAGAAEVDEETTRGIESARGGGAALPAAERREMEGRLGHDFGSVRVHAGPEAARLARSVEARAFTVGRDVFFGAGEYRPGTAAGRRLLAHELAHTVQQGAAPRAEELRRQEAAAPAAADPAADRVRAARALVDKLKAAGAKYRQQPRDWDATDFADCSKFVQLALEGAEQGGLLGGREKATTAAMREVIHGLTGDPEKSFRTTDPRPGDIMMWGGHVGIVTEVTEVKGVPHLLFAHMGGSGPRELGKSANGYYWLKVSDTAKIATLGAGDFLGYWTP